ncbi:MAG: hypothetical protein V1846_02300 [Candidatus Komeilibacteria bacterium]
MKKTRKHTSYTPFLLGKRVSVVVLTGVLFINLSLVAQVLAKGPSAALEGVNGDEQTSVNNEPQIDPVVSTPVETTPVEAIVPTTDPAPEVMVPAVRPVEQPGAYSAPQCTSVAPVATIVADKIVCQHESSLPNWGADPGVTINANTAANFVRDSKGDCSLVPGWKFQWSFNELNPGDQIGEASSPWTTFGPTNGSGRATTPVLLAGNSEIKLREVFQSGYIPFTGIGTTANVSAEFYCYNDVLNYDNYDFVRNAEAGHTYYCVAWNVAIPQCLSTLDYNDGQGGGPEGFLTLGDAVKFTSLYEGALGHHKGQAKYDATVDVNGDGKVSIADYYCAQPYYAGAYADVNGITAAPQCPIDCSRACVNPLDLNKDYDLSHSEEDQFNHYYNEGNIKADLNGNQRVDYGDKLCAGVQFDHDTQYQCPVKCAAVCGDGIVQKRLGEQCDNGTGHNTADCTAGCKLRPTAPAVMSSEVISGSTSSDVTAPSVDTPSEPKVTVELPVINFIGPLVQSEAPDITPVKPVIKPIKNVTLNPETVLITPPVLVAANNLPVNDQLSVVNTAVAKPAKTSSWWVKPIAFLFSW